MGLFNIIKLNKECPKCGAEVEWQTKNLKIDDIYPVENLMNHYDLNSRMDAEVHTFCDKCNKWIELIIKKGKIVKES